MSISGVSSAGTAYQPTYSSPSAAMSAYMTQLGNALQSGNMTAIQQAYSQAEAAVQPAQTSSTSTGSAASQGSLAAHVLRNGLGQIGQDIKSGNLTAASADFATLQQRLHSALTDPAAFHPNRHPHTGGSTTPASGSSSVASFVGVSGIDLLA